MIPWAFIGFLMGWFMTGLADYLPRFAATPPANLPPAFRSKPAAWRLLRSGSSERENGFSLRLAAELGSAAAFGYLWARSGWPGELLAFSAIYLFFLLIALIDIQYRLILNLITYPGIAALLMVHLVFQQQSPAAVLIGGALAFSLFYLTARLRPGDLGSGDVKLAALIGVYFGFPQMLWALIVGAGAGAVFAVALLASKRGNRKLTIPYAPFLCVGALVALLYNPVLISL
jgi:prepilin signal peptidase PulO-like enzyme (type II secretory pathway)